MYILLDSLIIGAMSLEEDQDGKQCAPNTFPLNSKWLTTRLVHRIVAALKLPKAPLADMQQMLEGSLGQECKLWSVQVEMEASLIIRLKVDGGLLDYLRWRRRLPAAEEEAEVVAEAEVGNGGGGDHGRRHTCRWWQLCAQGYECWKRQLKGTWISRRRWEFWESCRERREIRQIGSTYM